MLSISISKLAEQFISNVTISSIDVESQIILERSNAKKAIDLIALGLNYDDDILIEVEGSDEILCFDEVVLLITDGNIAI